MQRTRGLNGGDTISRESRPLPIPRGKPVTWVLTECTQGPGGKIQPALPITPKQACRSHLPHPGAEGCLPGASLLQAEVGIKEDQVDVAFQVLQASQLQSPSLLCLFGGLFLEDKEDGVSKETCCLTQPTRSLKCLSIQQSDFSGRAWGTAWLGHRGDTWGTSSWMSLKPISY